jgi:hypothetical protein
MNKPGEKQIKTSGVSSDQSVNDITYQTGRAAPVSVNNTEQTI